MPLLDSKSIPPELLAIYEQEEHWGEEPEKEVSHINLLSYWYNSCYGQLNLNTQLCSFQTFFDYM